MCVSMFAVRLKIFQTLQINTIHPKFASYVCVTIQKNLSFNINDLRRSPPFSSQSHPKKPRDPNPSPPNTTRLPRTCPDPVGATVGARHEPVSTPLDLLPIDLRFNLWIRPLWPLPSSSTLKSLAVSHALLAPGSPSRHCSIIWRKMPLWTSFSKGFPR